MNHRRGRGVAFPLAGFRPAGLQACVRRMGRTRGSANDKEDMGIMKRSTTRPIRGRHRRSLGVGSPLRDGWCKALALSSLFLCTGVAASAETRISIDDGMPETRQGNGGISIAYREDGQRRDTISSQARRTNSAVIEDNPLAKVLPRPKPERTPPEEAVEDSTATPEPAASTTEDAAEEPAEPESVAATPPEEVATPEPEEVKEAVPAPPTLSVSRAEANESASEIVFNLVLSEPLEKPILILYATYDQTATAGEDYEGERGTLKLAPGDKAATVRIPLIDDNVSEGDETLELFVTTDKTQATVAPERSIGTIMNDDN